MYNLFYIWYSSQIQNCDSTFLFVEVYCFFLYPLILVVGRNMYLCCNKVNSCVRREVCLFIYVVIQTRRDDNHQINGSSGSQEIGRILLNPKFHYRVHKSPSPVMGQMNPVQTFPYIQLFVEQLCIGYVD